MNEILKNRIVEAAKKYCQDENYILPDDTKLSLEALTAIDAYIEAAKSILQNQWISVDEELPKDKKYVFVKLSCGRLPWTAMFDYDLKSWVDVNHVAIHGITHWMEIPKGGEK